LAELVEHQAAFYRSWPTNAGRLLAEALEALASQVRYLNATTPAEFEARAGTIEQEARQQWEDVGYEQGKAAALAECERRHGGRARNVFEGGPGFED
jgi:hypothetical protein